MNRRARTLSMALLFVPLALAPEALAGDAPRRPDTFREWISQTLTGTWWVGARAGAIHQKRDDWEFGQFAFDSNDFGAATTLASISPQRGFDFDDWGESTEFFAGRNWREGVDVEFRFGFSVFDHKATDNIEAGVTGDGPVIQFWTPYLDGGHFPNPRRPRRDGIYGVRWEGHSKGDLDYDSQIFDFGVDLVYTVIENERTLVRAIAGPAMAVINQDFGYEFCCNAHGSGGGPGTEISVSEDIEEIFAGLKLGAQGSQVLNDWLTLAGTANVYLYGRHAELDGRQKIPDGNGIPALRIDVDDEESDFAPRLTARPGVIIDLEKLLPILPLPKNFSLGVFYEFNVWFNTSKVENPGLALVTLEGDPRWIGNEEAHLENDTLITHGIQVEATIHF